MSGVHEPTNAPQISAVSIDGNRATHRPERLTPEAPLHIRVNGVAYTTTMRTPGADRELARGLLFTEGIVVDPSAPLVFRDVPDPESGVTACLEVDVPVTLLEKEVEGRRTLVSASSCGVCGTREPADLELYGPPLTFPRDATLDASLIPTMMTAMRARQPLFEATGGCHAAAAFADGSEPLAVFEDIGRHNAVDKVVGALLERGMLSDAQCLAVSGRVSYEIVFKAYRAGIPILLAVSAVSAMAAETAERFGIAIAGFCRDTRATVYTHPERLRLPSNTGHDQPS